MAGHRSRFGLGFVQNDGRPPQARSLTLGSSVERPGPPSRLVALRARLGSLALVSALVAGPVQAATFTVNSIGDAGDAAPGDGTCATGGGVCTLRAALDEANNLAGNDAIRFSIGGGGPQTITLLAALPTITTVVSIDGTTQPGFLGAPLFAPIIELNAAAGGPSTLHLLAGSSGSTIRGLCINRGPGSAIRIVGSSGNTVVGNFLGTNLAGTAPGPGNQVGVSLGFAAATDNNQIGGAAPADRNVISGNAVDGIQVTGGAGGAANNRIQGNHIGVDVNGTAALGNASRGVAVFGTSSNTVIGGLAAGEGNVISGNTADGIRITGAGATGTLVRRNRIGTNAAGTAPLPNVRGVEISASATGNTVGGPLGSQNLISGNSGQGVLIAGVGTTNNTVSRALIGTNAAGNAKIPNGGHGVEIANGASNNTIGGVSGAGNVISGNSATGVNVVGAGVSGNSILGNIIGLDLAGGAILGNTQFGVAIAQGATANIVGNATGGNIISGNDAAGVRIVDAGTNGNLVQSNLIGLDATGTLARPNAFEGVILDAGGVATGNRIGGVGFTNAISGNGTVGVRILNGMTGTLVVANLIGRNATNSAGVPNGSGGVRIQDSSNNTIGGMIASEGNVIAGNGGSDGVAVVGATATGNAILANSVYSNAGLGIDLGDDGVTAEDLGDGDAGPNNLQNYPILSAVTTNGARVHIAGSLRTVPGSYRVEFFAHNSPDPAGFGEGARYLGFQDVTTDAAGNAVIYANLTAAVAAATDYVTATATNLISNDTSEFARNLTAVGELIVTTTASAADAPDTSSIAALIADTGADGRISLREAILATNAAAGTDTIRFGIPLTDANHYYYQIDATPGLSIIAATARADAEITDFDPHYPAGTTRSWYRITLGAALPDITSPVVLDTTTQPLSAAGTGPVVELNGAGVANAGLSLRAGSDGSTIRGFVINRCTTRGILIRASSNNVVAGNLLGTNPAGTAPGPGNNQGIFIGAVAPTNNNRVGGTVAADRNIISGNTVNGVLIDGDTSSTANNVVEGNYIGTDVTGTVAVPNTNEGVAVFTNLAPGSNTNNVIGTPGAGNVISGNGRVGVLVRDTGTTGTLVQGNKIGTNALGTAAIPNGGAGIEINETTANNTIGGAVPGEGNVIAYNNSGNTLGWGGIAFSAGTGNAILGNSIHSNTGLGIDLGEDGVTPNDPLDGDAGPNDLLNSPEITSVLHYGGTLTVRCRLDVPAGSYRIEYFKNPSGADASGYGEGEVFITSRDVGHAGTGAAYFNQSFAGSAGDVVTVTATACTAGCTVFGSTSELSNAATAVTTAVGLTSFTATPRDGAVDVSWTTGSEVGNLGFHLYRSLASSGPWTRLNPALIPGQGFSATGASYAWNDPGLTNGTLYHYRLEDVDSASVSTFHGPVSAVPEADAGPPPPEPGGSDSGDGGGSPPTCPPWALAQLDFSTSYTCETHGDPAATSFRVLSRTARSVRVELETRGFLTARDATGRVRSLLPGFDSLSDPLAPALPLKRARLDGVVGRRARIGSIEARDERTFDGLVAAAVGYPQARVATDGTVRAGRRSAPLGPSRGVLPRAQARLAGESFQGEDKTLALELMPLRYDATRGALVLSGRLAVRVDFAGVEPSEIGRGRVGRRAPRPRPDSNTSAFLGTRQRGLHSVPFESVFPGSSAPRALTSLRLTRDSGRVLVPFFVLPRTSSFGPGSRLFFHVDRAASSMSFSPEVVYALEHGTGGLSMSVLSAAPDASPAVPSRGTASIETNRIFAPDVLDIEDLWQWESLGSGVSKTRPFALDGLDASSPETARLVVFLQGGSDAESVVDHHVQVFVNGALVAEESFDGAVPHRVKADLPASLLAATNEITVTNVGDTGVSSRVFLDRFEVHYPQSSAAPSGIFDGVFSGTGTAEVSGIASPAALLDVTAGASWITGYVAGPSLRFRARAGHRYLAVSPEALLAPRVFFPEPAARLRSTRNQADYVLVAPRAFLDAAHPLLLRRESQGLTTFVASLEEIASSFGGGQASAEAIRDFLSCAYHQWRRPSPRYVLLLGDANHDPRHFNPVSQPSPMPFLLQRTSFIWTASDPALAAVNGDDILPDLAIGRLPATTLEQARTMIQKILDWEAQGQTLDGPAALVADNPDAAGDFEAEARDIEASFLSGRETTEIFLGQIGDRDVARARILDAFDSGLSLISYVGHGGGAVWAGENMLNSSDPASLLAQPRQPFMLTMNCLNGYFITPFYESLAEGFLKADGRGTIGAFSPSGLSLDGPAHLYHRALVQEIATGQHPRIGDAVLAAQKAYARAGAFPELLSVYHLFGDPAMKLRRDAP
jgi:CSLREA domain-containing protein